MYRDQTLKIKQIFLQKTNHQAKDTYNVSGIILIRKPPDDTFSCRR